MLIYLCPEIMRFRGSFAGVRDDGFENNLLMTLRGPVIFGALFGGTVDFTDEEWQALASNYQTPDGGPVNRTMLCATRAAVFRRRAKLMWTHGVHDPTLVHDVTSSYETMQQCRDTLSTVLEKLQKRFTAGELDYATFFQWHFAYIRLYALALGVVCVFGAMMSTLNPDYPELEKDMHDCTVEVLNLAERFQPYRPLGAGIIPVSLGAAWTVVTDPLLKEQVAASIKDYMTDHGQDISDEGWTKSMNSMKRRLTLRD